MPTQVPPTNTEYLTTTLYPTLLPLIKQLLQKVEDENKDIEGGGINWLAEVPHHIRIEGAY